MRGNMERVMKAIPDEVKNPELYNRVAKDEEHDSPRIRVVKKGFSPHVRLVKKPSFDPHVRLVKRDFGHHVRLVKKPFDPHVRLVKKEFSPHVRLVRSQDYEESLESPDEYEVTSDERVDSKELWLEMKTTSQAQDSAEL